MVNCYLFMASYKENTSAEQSQERKAPYDTETSHGRNVVIFFLIAKSFAVYLYRMDIRSLAVLGELF